MNVAENRAINRLEMIYHFLFDVFIFSLLKSSYPYRYLKCLEFVELVVTIPLLLVTIATTFSLAIFPFLSMHLRELHSNVLSILNSS